MKALGLIALVFGLLGLLAGLTMDTTVPVNALGTRVHNIGLMADKQNLLLMFSVVGIVGAIIFAISRGKKVEVTLAKACTSHERACPFCAETIKADAILCRYCKSSLAKPVSETLGSEPSQLPSEPQCIDGLVATGCHVVEPIKGVWEVRLPTGITVYAYSHEDLVKLMHRQESSVRT